MPRLITLGGLSVQNGTIVNGLANPRSRLAILAVLAVAGDRGIRREKLAAMFWPDSDEERGRSALRQALFTLKRDVGTGEITLGGVDLRLNTEVLSADVMEFELALRDGRYEDAATLYRGPFLDGVVVREAPEFERWVDEQRTRLSAEVGRALEKAAASAAARGDTGTAATWWERRALHDPLSSRVARLYMEALVAAGDREHAIRHAASHAQLVREELEADPDAEVLAFAAKLREANPPNGLEPRTKPVAAARHLTPLHAGEQRGVASDEGAQHGFRARTAWSSSFGLRVVGILLAIGSVMVAVRALSAKSPPIQPRLVALASLENRGADTTLDALGEAAVTSIAEILTQSARVRVVDLRGATPNGQRPRKVDALARESQAEFLVRGALSRRGDSVEAVMQVVSARGGELHQQLEPIVIHRSNAGHLIEELRERVGGTVVALNDTLFPLWRSGRSRPPRYSAYHEFSQGLDALVNQGPEPAMLHFRKAMALDPDFAQAKIWYLEQAVAESSEKVRMDSVRAALEAQRGNFVTYDQVATDRQLAFLDGRLEDVYTAARQMAMLAPEAPDAKFALAQAAIATRRFREGITVLHSVRNAPSWIGGLPLRQSWDLHAHRLLGDLEEGIVEWRRFVAAAPDEFRACAMGFPLLAAAGRVAEVDSLLLACSKLPDAQPTMDGYLQQAGRNYRQAGHTEEAQRAFRRALAIRIDLAAQGKMPKLAVAQLYIDLGEWRAAYDLLNGMTEPGDAARLALAVSATHVGDSAAAREALRMFETRSRRDGADMNRALIQLALGERDSALASLRAAISAGVAPPWNAWYLRPELRPLRGDPRFEELVRPIK